MYKVQFLCENYCAHLNVIIERRRFVTWNRFWGIDLIKGLFASRPLVKWKSIIIGVLLKCCTDIEFHPYYVCQNTLPLVSNTTNNGCLYRHQYVPRSFLRQQITFRHQDVYVPRRLGNSYLWQARFRKMILQRFKVYLP